MRGWWALTFWSCVCLGVVLLSRQPIHGAPPSGWRPVSIQGADVSIDSAVASAPADPEPVLGLFEAPFWGASSAPPREQSGTWMAQIPSRPPEISDLPVTSQIITVAAQRIQTPPADTAPVPVPPAELPFFFDLPPISAVPPVVGDLSPLQFEETSSRVAQVTALQAPPAFRDEPPPFVPPPPPSSSPIAQVGHAAHPPSTQIAHAAHAEHHCEHCRQPRGHKSMIPCETVHHGRFASFGHLGGWLGNRRVIGDGGVWIPLWQNPDSLVSLHVQGRVDDHDAGQFNLGFGYRTYLNPSWIFGSQIYYDLFRSSQRNVYHQATLGVELLSLNWDFRINGHFPQSGGETASAARTVSNGMIVTQGFVERAYAGFDAEFGHRLLRWGWNDDYEVRWFLGGYYFDHTANGFSSFGGPQSRIEFRMYDLPLLGVQSRVVCGAEASWDSMRHEQIAAFLRVRIPLCGWRDRDRLDPLRRRMLDQPIRDVE